MNRKIKTLALAMGLLTAALTGCSNGCETISTSNVMDEILTCELDEFSDAMGGTMLSDWRRLGGDGIEVSTTEDGVDVRYSFTLESGD